MDNINQSYTLHHNISNSYAHLLRHHHHISWGAIIAGMVTSFMVAMVLSLLLVGLGFTNFSIDNMHETSSFMSFGVSTLLIMVISLFTGSFVAGRSVHSSGALHGFLNWACLSLVTILLSAFALSSALRFSAVMIGGNYDFDSKSESNVELYKPVGNNISENIRSVLKNYGLSDDYLKTYQDIARQKLEGKNFADSYFNFDKQQLADTRYAISKAVEKYRASPLDANYILDNLKNELQSYINKLNGSVTYDDLANKLAANGFDKDRAKILAQDSLNEVNMARVETRNKISDAKEAINKAQLNIDSLGKPSYLIEDTANKAGHSALWAFISSIMGALISMLAGSMGSKIHRRKCEAEYYDYSRNYEHKHNNIAD